MIKPEMCNPVLANWCSAIVTGRPANTCLICVSAAKHEICSLPSRLVEVMHYCYCAVQGEPLIKDCHWTAKTGFSFITAWNEYAGWVCMKTTGLAGSPIGGTSEFKCFTPKSRVLLYVCFSHHAHILASSNCVFYSIKNPRQEIWDRSLLFQLESMNNQ